jgi:putative DNA primase/helicase
MPQRGAEGAGRIDFKALAAELLHRASELVPTWLRGGREDGHEYKCGDLTGGKGDSCSVNLRTGQWCDFANADEHKGGDLISLYAAIHGMEQLDAARDLVRDLNLTSCVVSAPSPARERPKPTRPDAFKGDKGEFTTITPVPPGLNPPNVHRYRGEPERVWTYRRDGQVLGYVYRFRTSDGGKEVIPLTWGQSLRDGSQKWVWKTWSEPRPLYFASGESPRSGVPKVIVEGEKCADALHAILGAEFDVISWPGGGKAATRADWTLLRPAGDATPMRVILWPDADYKRRKVTAEEKAGGVDEEAVDYLPASKQPGVSAMAKIAQHLHALFEPKIWVTKIPDPPANASDPRPLPDGWDCADAIESGWDAEQCRKYLRQSRLWEPLAAAPADGPGSAGAGSGPGKPDPDNPTGWRVGLIRGEDGKPRVARENVVLALMSLPEVRGHIAFNEFSNDIIKLADMPWGSPAGKWTEVDELLMGEWLVRTQYFPSMPRTTLEEGMRMVATRHQYHPVREYVRGLEWDGEGRLNTWLMRSVVKDPDGLSKRERRYLERVGTWFLMGMVARAMHPGCKFDYMPILEGAQGMRKSTVLNVLAGDWFADTGFVLGDKDSLQMLQGRWLYEISELDAMARAEVTKIKAFVASKSDWYRASFDKRPREYPRQLVFAGTTNEHQYLVDGTGNRRFWPVDVTRIIDTEWVAANRDQLFAEAWARLQQGERYFPTQREELELFLPQQRARMVESPIEIRILDHLVNDVEAAAKPEVQIVKLLAAIGIDITKLGPGRFHEKQAGTALRKFGWERKRSSMPGRPWVYVRPDNWPACMDLDELEESPPQRPQAPAEVGENDARGRRRAAPAMTGEAHERADYDDSIVLPSTDESGGDEPF